jgi:hypothetical protein
VLPISKAVPTSKEGIGVPGPGGGWTKGVVEVVDGGYPRTGRGTEEIEVVA